MHRVHKVCDVYNKRKLCKWSLGKTSWTQNNSRNLPSILSPGRASGTADRGYSFRTCPELISCAQNFTLSLPAPGPISPTSVFLFLPWVLTLWGRYVSCQHYEVRERENSYKLQLRRSLAWSSNTDKLLLTSSMLFKVYWGFLGDWVGAGTRGLASAAPALGAPCFPRPCEFSAEAELSLSSSILCSFVCL